MKTLQNIFLLAICIFISTPIFSQNKTTEKYNQEMGEALDKLSPKNLEHVLEKAIELLEEENARKSLACMVNNLSKEDQEQLLQYAQKMDRPWEIPSVVDRTYPSGSSNAYGSAAPTPPIGPTTSIEFAESTFDFGTIIQGEMVSHVYKFTNTGTEPLIITNAKGSCGCTVPVWPKAPIAPGESGEIKVEFNSKGKKGKQSKRVTITANTDPLNTYLTIKGDIEVKEKLEKN